MPAADDSQPARRARRRAVALAAVSLTAVTLLLAACAGLPPPADFDTTPREDRDTVVVYGDTRPRLFLEFWRDDATRERLAVLDAVAAERPALVVHSGDLVAQGNDPADWAQFDRETAALRAEGVPFVAALGNHDLSGDADEALRLFARRFPAAAGSPEARPRWREVRWRRVAFVLLDTNLTRMEPGDADRELAWLDGTLDSDEADPSIDAVVLVAHHPPFTNVAAHRPSEWVRREVLGRAATHGKVRAVFSGHAHTYERFDWHGVPCVVSGGGGAPLMSLRDAPLWPDVYSGPRSFEYCRIRDDAGLTCEVVMLGRDGAWSVADRFEIGRGARAAGTSEPGSATVRIPPPRPPGTAPLPPPRGR